MSRPAVAHISRTSLQHNYGILAARAGRAVVMAVVKANAYGHGLHLVGPALHEAGCKCFAVTDAGEGATLREIIGQEADIVALSGLFDMADARLAVQFRLIPVVFTAEHVLLLRDAGFTGSVWIKVDTGMHRLGADDPVALLRACLDAGITIGGVMSHLACADTPGHPLNAAQASRFAKIRHTLPVNIPASLLNSAGLACMPEFSLDVVRPGIALYGTEPAANIRLGLKPVMQFCGRIMQITDVPAGATISYGATHTAERDMRIAVVSCGYADGLPRVLSNRGFGSWQGNRLPIIGRVCMDYCLLDVGGYTPVPGDEVEFWGATQPAAEVAANAGTISYELFTGVGHRVQRLATETAS